MSTIRKLPEEDLDEYVRIVYNAYPGFGLDMEKLRGRMLKILKEDTVSNLYGLYREGKLLGGMRCLDLTMKLLSTKTVGGGVGLVAVDLLHKEEKVCKELITYFLKHYRKKGISIALLYPFRPDFYKKMGFGYGTKVNQYRIKPESLPKGDSKKNTRFLDEDDREALLECYNRLMD